MKRLTLLMLSAVLVLGACAAPAVATINPSPAAASPIPSTSTLEPKPTATATPQPTPIPGVDVVPVATMGVTMPWLPLDASARPATYYYVFNLRMPPFDNVLVRQAFAAAIDREALAEIARKYGQPTAKPATTFTPPETLGRDLYNVVGMRFDPARARELLIRAGYADAATFPTVTMLTSKTGDPMPGAFFKIADAMVKMWKENLGVQVNVQILPGKTYADRTSSNPSELFRQGWVADVNDPDNFLRDIFRSGSQYNKGDFSSSEFDRLVDRAHQASDPAERQALYIQAERILCESEVALIPIVHIRWRPQ